MTDRSNRDTQAGDGRIVITGAILALSFGASALLGSALPAGLGLSFALWQALRTRLAAPAPMPVRARAGRGPR